VGTTDTLNLLLIVIVVLIVLLGFIALLIIINMKKKDKVKEEEKIQVNSNNTKKDMSQLITRQGKLVNSIYKFMEFDGIVNNMIVRHNNTQYVMVIECEGINYDLLSEDEKDGLEAGFIEFLNTLRFPIQLYVQTRKIDLNEILRNYEKKMDLLKDDIKGIDQQINLARNSGNQGALNRLIFNRNRKQNILEYGQSIQEYTGRINENKNMLQQKTYVILSYYTSELGDSKKYSQSELAEIIFGELYIRAETLISALGSADVTGKVLTSEELAELLYVAYNREGAETYSLQKALDSQYDRLYSTSIDRLEERKEKIKAQVEVNAAKLASQSLIKADQKLKEERQKRAKEIRKRATEFVDEYKGEMNKSLYNATIQEIESANIEELEKNKKKEG